MNCRDEWYSYQNLAVHVCTRPELDPVSGETVAVPTATPMGLILCGKCIRAYRRCVFSDLPLGCTTCRRPAHFQWYRQNDLHLRTSVFKGSLPFPRWTPSACRERLSAETVEATMAKSAWDCWDDQFWQAAQVQDRFPNQIKFRLDDSEWNDIWTSWFPTVVDDEAALRLYKRYHMLRLRFYWSHLKEVRQASLPELHADVPVHHNPMGNYVFAPIEFSPPDSSGMSADLRLRERMNTVLLQFRQEHRELHRPPTHKVLGPPGSHDPDEELPLAPAGGSEFTWEWSPDEKPEDCPSGHEE